ncbi:hypothetical protein GQ457_02G010050 [Hibiscus cannabinus]
MEMERTQAFRSRGERAMVVQAELMDAMDQNLLQLKLNPNPENLQALEFTRRLLIEVNRQAALWMDEADDYVKGLLDELPPADD